MPLSVISSIFLQSASSSTCLLYTSTHCYKCTAILTGCLIASVAGFHCISQSYSLIHHTIIIQMVMTGKYIFCTVKLLDCIEHTCIYIWRRQRAEGVVCPCFIYRFLWGWPYTWILRRYSWPQDYDRQPEPYGADEAAQQLLLRTMHFAKRLTKWLTAA